MKEISIPTLNFFPFKLSATRKKIEANIKKSLGDIDNPVMFEYDKNLSLTTLNLIDRLSKIKSEQELLEFSRKLKDKDLRILLSYLSFYSDKIDYNVKTNIIKLTCVKLKESFIKQLWSVFQTLFLDSTVIYALKLYFQKVANTNKQIGINEQDFLIIKQWIEKGAEIKDITEYITKADMSFIDIQRRFSIKDDKPLFRELCWKIAVISKSTNLYCNSDNLKYIYDILKKTNSEEKFLQFYNHYLNILETKYFDKKLIEILIDRYGEPNKAKVASFWNLFDENAKQKLILWINEQKLLLFFNDDNERFNFWKQFIKYMEYVFPDKQNYRVFMFFKNIVAIEFGDIGNAIYAYSKDYFRKKFELHMNTDKSNNFFKDKTNCLFRIAHQGNWRYNTIKNLYKYEDI